MAKMAQIDFQTAGGAQLGEIFMYTRNAIHTEKTRDNSGAKQ